jgi:hypothetical protein
VKTRKPKTGEKRRARQPLKIDRLPAELRERIQAERAAGLTWEEIEDISSRFKEWEQVPEKVRALFPELKLPHTTLQRWYDLRVEQVRRETMASAAKAREFAAAFAGPGLKDLPEAVRNALGDQIFSLMQSADAKDQARFRAELLKLGTLLTEYRKLDIAERKQKTEERALELKVEQMREKVTELKKDVAAKKKEMSPAELQKKLDEIYGIGA